MPLLMAKLDAESQREQSKARSKQYTEPQAYTPANHENPNNTRSEQPGTLWSHSACVPLDPSLATTALRREKQSTPKPIPTNRTPPQGTYGSLALHPDPHSHSYTTCKPQRQLPRCYTHPEPCKARMTAFQSAARRNHQNRELPAGPR